MFVNQVLFRYKNVASVFYLTFWNARMLFITFSSKNSRIFHEKVKFWAAKATKIIEILDLFKNAHISKFFC